MARFFSPFFHFPKENFTSAEPKLHGLTEGNVHFTFTCGKNFTVFSFKPTLDKTTILCYTKEKGLLSQISNARLGTFPCLALFL